MERIKLAIVTDVRVYGECVAAWVDGRNECDVVGVFCNAYEAVGGVVDCRPNVVLIDTRMSDAGWLIERLKDGAPSVELIALGVESTPSEIVRCASAGFSGYLPAQCSLADFCRIIRETVRGELACSPHLSKQLFLAVARETGAQADASQNHGRLTDRESQILSLLSRGQTNKQIARELSIGVSTVKNHVHSILTKLHVKRRADAAVVHQSGLQRFGRTTGRVDSLRLRRGPQ